MRQTEIPVIKLTLDRSGVTPIFYQIEMELERLIKSGRLHSGDRLPGDTVLAGQMGVNHLTVRKAFASLSKKQLIRRSRKSGTFVADGIVQVRPTIGLFFLREAEPIFGNMMECLQRELGGRGFDLKIQGFERDFYDKIDLSNEIQRMSLAGTVIMSMNCESCKNSLLELEKRAFPYVRIGAAYFPGILRSVLVRGNEGLAARAALSYLWNKGHRRIGLIGSLSRNDGCRAYESFYVKHGKHDPRWLMRMEFPGPLEKWPQTTCKVIARGYLESNPELTAVMVEHPGTCIDLLREAGLCNRSVPKRLSLLCLRGWGLDGAMPPITAMGIPSDSWADAVATRLLETMEHGFAKKEEIILLEYKLEERESVGRG